MKRSVLAQLDVLNTLKGHDKEKISIEDNDPRKRKALAKKIVDLIRDGFAVILADGQRVRGYDADANEWLVASSDRAKSKKNVWDRISAIGKPANAIAPRTGG